jgi:hypothetical protein
MYYMARGAKTRSQRPFPVGCRDARYPQRALVPFDRSHSQRRHFDAMGFALSRKRSIAGCSTARKFLAEVTAIRFSTCLASIRRYWLTGPAPDGWYMLQMFRNNSSSAHPKGSR